MPKIFPMRRERITIPSYVNEIGSSVPRFYLLIGQTKL